MTTFWTAQEEQKFPNIFDGDLELVKLEDAVWNAMRAVTDHLTAEYGIWAYSSIPGVFLRVADKRTAAHVPIAGGLYTHDWLHMNGIKIKSTRNEAQEETEQ